MKKILGIGLMVLALFGMIGCTPKEEPVFEVGSDTGSYEPATLTGYEVTRTVYIQIMGPNDDELFNGTVTVKSSNPTVYEALLAACTGKGISQTSASDSGFVTAIDDYVNGTNDMYWMASINGESLLVGANSSQIRNNDYIQWVFEAFVW